MNKRSLFEGEGVLKVVTPSQIARPLDIFPGG